MMHTSYDPQLKIWSGPKCDPIYNTNVGIGYLILNVLKMTPERITQVSADTNVELTCHEMRIRSMKIANYLKSCGFKLGDVVGLMASNSENLAPIVFACFTLGLPVNPLAPVMTSDDVVHMYSKTKPKIIFCDGDLVGTVQEAVDRMKIQTIVHTLMKKVVGYTFVDDILLSDFNEDDFVFPELNNIAKSTAMILCSSGTTGLPKGVCKSHEQVIAHLHPIWKYHLPSQEVYFNFSSLYWLSGMYFLISGTLYGGKRIITAEQYEADLAVEYLDKFKVATYLSAPSAVSTMLRSRKMQILKHIKAFSMGGAIVSKKLCENLQSYLPNGKILVAYGSTEFDFATNSKRRQRYGSVGQTNENVQINIIDDAGKSLRPNEEGEVVFKTEIDFPGYYGEPELSKAATDNGWMYSGDLGYFDDDGFLYIVGRKKDMLKYNNYQIAPSELEAMIDGIKGVASSCVVGVLEEDTGNDILYAFVIKDRSRNDLTGDFILNYVNNKVIDAKKLRGGVHFVDSLPMTVSGKIQRQEIQKLAQQKYFQGGN